MNGWYMDISGAKLPGVAEVGYNMYQRTTNESGFDITPLFKRSAANDYPACLGRRGAYATSDDCTVTGQLTACPLGDLTQANLRARSFTNTTRKVGYGWEDIASNRYPNILVSRLQSQSGAARVGKAHVAHIRRSSMDSCLTCSPTSTPIRGQSQATM